RHQHWFSPPVMEGHGEDIFGGEIKRKSRENQTKIKRIRPPRPAARRRGTKKGPSSEDGAAYRQMEHTSAGMQEGVASPFLSHPQRRRVCREERLQAASFE